MKKARIGELLKHWRAIRAVPQRELAERAGVSARHLAFIEGGKAHPSREAVVWLARALKVPHAEEAAFLEAAGYLPDDVEAPVLDAALAGELDAALAALAHPALVHDVRGTIVAANAAFAALVAPLVGALSPFVGSASGGHRLLAALRPHLEDADALAAHYLRRVRDARLRGHGAPSPELEALFARLAAESPETADGEALDRRVPHPLVLPVAARIGGVRVAVRVLTSTLGTPASTTLRALRLAQLLPAVGATGPR